MARRPSGGVAALPRPNRLSCRFVEPGAYVHTPSPPDTKKPGRLAWLFGYLAEEVGLTPGHPWPGALRAVSLRSPVQIGFPADLSNRVRTSTHPLRQIPKKPGRLAWLFWYLAERVGFEPTIGGYPILEFQSSAFDHSATSPEQGREDYRTAYGSSIAALGLRFGFGLLLAEVRRWRIQAGTLLGLHR